MSTGLFSDMAEVEKVFKRFDTNNDGKISIDELSGLLSALGSKNSPSELQDMMKEMDTDKDGVITLDEFSNFCKNTKVDSSSRELRDAFEMYDQDNNGLISASELHLVLTRLGQPCSIHVSFDEFRVMMSKSA